MRPRGLHDVLRNTDAFGPGCTASALMAVQEHRIFSFLAQAAVQPDTYLRSGCSVTPSCDAPDHSDRAGRVDIPYRRAASISTTHLQYLVNATSEGQRRARHRESENQTGNRASSAPMSASHLVSRRNLLLESYVLPPLHCMHAYRNQDRPQARTSYVRYCKYLGGASR